MIIYRRERMWRQLTYTDSGQDPESDFCVPSVFVNASNFLTALMIISSSQTAKLGRWVLGFYTMILAGDLYLFYLCIILFIYTLHYIMAPWERLQTIPQPRKISPSSIELRASPASVYCALPMQFILYAYNFFRCQTSLKSPNFPNHIACNVCIVSKVFILCQNEWMLWYIMIFIPCVFLKQVVLFG
jgi:hypothetical protein